MPEGAKAMRSVYMLTSDLLKAFLENKKIAYAINPKNVSSQSEVDWQSEVNWRLDVYVKTSWLDIERKSPATLMFHAWVRDRLRAECNWERPFDMQEYRDAWMSLKYKEIISALGLIAINSDED